MTKTGRGAYTHLERGSFRCTVYAQRPIPCRAFDCRNDKRIWLDFERRIVNPLIDTPDWPGNVSKGATEG